jgi:hypothetical protein
MLGAEMDKREQMIQGYNQWLQAYTYQWFGTLKLTSGIPSTRRAIGMFDRWISNLRKIEGGDRFRWFRVLECGVRTEVRHVHFVLGGLRNRRIYWQQQWNGMGGEARIERYDAERNGILYILKDTNAAGDLNFDFEFPSKL